MLGLLGLLILLTNLLINLFPVQLYCISLFLFLFRLCPKVQEYQIAYFKSAEFLSHYEQVSKQLVTDLQTALGDESFSKLLTGFLLIYSYCGV